MKRLFSIILIEIFCISIMAQSWDFLKHEMHLNSRYISYQNGEVRIPVVLQEVVQSPEGYLPIEAIPDWVWHSDTLNLELNTLYIHGHMYVSVKKINNMYYNINGYIFSASSHYKCYVDTFKNIRLSQPIYEEYKMGRTCYNVGSVFISIGLPLAFAGSIMMFVAKPNQPNQSNLITAGSVLLGVGGTFVSVSIPLLCFGDHMKRQANWNYKLHKEMLPEHK